MSTTPRLKLAPPAAYKVPPGASLIRLRDLDAQHRDRFIEIRDAVTGQGRVGRLADANHYLFDETVAIRYEAEQAGVFASPDDVVLVHRPGITLEAITAWYEEFR